MNADASHSSIRLYVIVWAALLLLLLITWGVAQIDLGALNIVATMTVAVMKMTLVVLFFMHVRHSPRVTWLFATAGFLWLLIMLVLTAGDYLTRTG